MTKDETIDALWEKSNHGTRREDVEAAYNAGAAAERLLWKKKEGYVLVMHPDDPMLCKLDGQMVFLQRTLPRSNAAISGAQHPID